MGQAIECCLLAGQWNRADELLEAMVDCVVGAMVGCIVGTCVCMGGWVGNGVIWVIKREHGGRKGRGSMEERNKKRREGKSNTHNACCVTPILTPPHTPHTHPTLHPIHTTHPILILTPQPASDAALAERCWLQLAEAYKSTMSLEQAQRCFVKAGHVRAAVDMYRQAKQWSLLHTVARKLLSTEQMHVCVWSLWVYMGVWSVECVCGGKCVCMACLGWHCVGVL